MTKEKETPPPPPCKLTNRWARPKNWAYCKNCHHTVKFSFKRAQTGMVSGIWCAKEKFTRVAAAPETPVPTIRGMADRRPGGKPS